MDNNRIYIFDTTLREDFRPPRNGAAFAVFPVVLQPKGPEGKNV